MPRIYDEKPDQEGVEVLVGMREYVLCVLCPEFDSHSETYSGRGWRYSLGRPRLLSRARATCAVSVR